MSETDYFTPNAIRTGKMSEYCHRTFKSVLLKGDSEIIAMTTPSMFIKSEMFALILVTVLDV